jgi:hypothetical protein
MALQVDRFGEAEDAVDPRLLENFERLLPCHVASKKGNRLVARLLDPGLSLEVVLARPGQVCGWRWCWRALASCVCVVGARGHELGSGATQLCSCRMRDLRLVWRPQLGMC